MPQFLTLLPPSTALSLFLGHIPDHPPVVESLDSMHALGRVTAGPVLAPHSLPAFDRSAVDGYAVHATDTYGANESLPAYLDLVGEVQMGAAPAFVVQKTQAVLIHTGGMLPVGADAVVMLEYTQVARQAELEVLRPVASGENILKKGEDVIENQEVIPSGRRIRPAELGGLMALGIMELRVAKSIKVGIISTGDEIVPPQVSPPPGQVRDINSYSLAALVSQAGGEPVLVGIIPDQLETLKKEAAKTLQACDLLLITAGSSASSRDMTAEVIRSLGEPGVLVHGVNIRPGKPTILAICDGKPVIGLPGNPVSALVIAGLFVVPAIEKLLGLKSMLPHPSVNARLTLNIPSQAGREDWVAVKLTPNFQDDAKTVKWLAEPVFSKSNLIFNLASADGLVRIPAQVTGLSAGEVCIVNLF